MPSALANIQSLPALVPAPEGAIVCRGEGGCGKVSMDAARTLLTTLGAASNVATTNATRKNLSDSVNATVGEFCRQAVNGRYPFARSSNTDVTQDDFGRLFAPGGLFDEFFQKNLVSLVDINTKPWTFRQLGEGNVARDSAALGQFQRAAAIRDTFFRAGGKVPGLRLDFKPVEMDESILQFTLDFDGQLVKYSHGPQIPSTVQWPGPKGSTQVRVQLQPTVAGSTSRLTTEGPWALFRMFDKLQIVPAGAPERFRATFNVDGRKAVFLVTASSVRNPFRLPELEQFSCPGKL
jgi:type VI secretion system protein ImpL